MHNRSYQPHLINSIRCLLLATVAGFFFFLATLSPVLADDKPSIALVMKALSNPFFSKMEEGARQYSLAHNIKLDVFGVERETDVELQINLVDNLLSRNYDAIVIAPADSKRLVPVCKKALDSGILVINIDNPFHRETLKKYSIDIPFVGSDNQAGAAMVGDYMRRKLGGKGNVLILEGIRGVENADLRKKGFIEAVTRESSIKVLASESANWHADEAFSLTTSLLEKFPEVNAIFCANDNMALGALKALELMELDQKILIGSYDNIDLVREQMKNGLIHATVEQHPELMGEYGVKLAQKGLQGVRIESQTSTPLDLITNEPFNQKIALSISSLDNPFFVRLQGGAQKAADLFGIGLVVFDAENNDANQLNDIITILDKNFSVLIINPTNSQMITPGIELVNQQKIPVITVDRHSAGGEILGHIGSDNSRGGKIAAMAMARYLNGHGNIIELEGIPGTSATQDRGAGFNQELQQYPKIKIVARVGANFDRLEAQKAISRILQQNIQFDGIFAHNDNMILGSLDALLQERANLNIITIGFDAIDEAVKEVQDGRITGTVAQQPEKMGWAAVQQAIQFLRGEKLAPETLVELKLIEK